MHIKFIGPLNCLGVGGGGQLLPFFIDLWSANLLLGMLGFPLSPKRHTDFCRLIFFIYSEFDIYIFFDVLQLQIIASISPKASVENSSAQWLYILMLYHSHPKLTLLPLSSYL